MSRVNRYYRSISDHCRIRVCIIADTHTAEATMISFWVPVDWYAAPDWEIKKMKWDFSQPGQQELYEVFRNSLVSCGRQEYEAAYAGYKEHRKKTD